MTYDIIQFTPVSLAQAPLVDPKISLKHTKGLTFEVSAEGGVGAWTWLDHPVGTVGYFAEPATGKPLNGFYLIPGMTRTGMSWPGSYRSVSADTLGIVEFVLNEDRSREKNPDPSTFVVRSLWNNTHL